jgi:cation:H+ antiporter
VAGTVVGSNVANIALIVGVAALGFRGLRVSQELRRRELPFMLGAAILLGLAGLGGRVSRLEGGVLLGLYLLYLAYSVHRQQNGAAVPRVGRFRWLTVLWLVFTAAGVYLGAEFTVRAVVRLTELAGLGDVSFLALTVVAVGSSLPELSVSWKAAAKGYHDISLGNVVGSNICNTFLVVGLPALVKPLPVSTAVQEVGMPFMLGLSALLVVVSRRRVAPLMGVVMLAAFAAFLIDLWWHL